ncbi:MAG: energy transducer TonB [Pseudomonadota bacterium]
MSEAFDPREPPGKWASAALAVFVHVILAVLLIYGIRWQSKPPEPVEVELYRALPSPPAVQAPPPPEPRPEPKPEPRPEPKPEPRPDIAVKEKEKSKPPPKPQPKPQEEPKKEPRPDDRAEKRRIEEVLKQEQQLLEQRKIEQELAQVKASQASAALAKAKASWGDKISAKIRGNTVLPPEIKGNPEAVFEVTLLPSGEVITVRLRKSSGNTALDAAFERAILKSSPLPKPEDARVFERTLTLKHKPFEE